MSQRPVGRDLPVQELRRTGLHGDIYEGSFRPVVELCLPGTGRVVTGIAHLIGEDSSARTSAWTAGPLRAVRSQMLHMYPWDQTGDPLALFGV